MTTTKLRVTTIASIGIAAAVTLSACGSSGGGSTSGGSTPTPTSSQQQSTQQQSTPSAGATSESATETEFHIALSSKSLKAGTVTFTVKNAGKITHALTVDGPGVEDKSTGDIAPGSSATLTVTLKAGKYDVYCPVADHKMEGMNETVQVA